LLVKLKTKYPELKLSRVHLGIIDSLSRLDFVEFHENSKEKFSCPYEKRFIVKDIIINILKTHRPIIHE
jgi:hypothetical protein